MAQAVTYDDHSVPDALVAAGRWEAARAALGPLLAANPQDPILLALLVRSLRGLGQTDQALQAVRALLTVTPSDPYALRLATLVLLDVGWVDEAIGTASRAVSLDPLNYRNQLAMARAWAESPRPQSSAAALAASGEALRLAPESPDAHVQMGAALAASGDAQAARIAYLEALALDPENSAALNNLAVLDLRAGEPAQASRHLAASLRADPHGKVALRNLDAVAASVIRRIGWWLLLAPIPALLAAASGQATAARILAVGAVLGMPALAARWWLAMTPGQRVHLRGMPRRVRWTVWVWPGVAAIMGSAGLIAAGVAAQWSESHVAAYLGLVVYISMWRLMALLIRRDGGPATPAERLSRFLEGP